MDTTISGILSNLGAREREVIVGRYGLLGASRKTLAEIGDRYGITRERVRQIEALALGKIRAAQKQNDSKEFVTLALTELRRLGGAAREDLLLASLANRTKANASDARFNNAAKFIMELSGKAFEKKEDLVSHAFWHLGGDSEKKVQGFVAKLVNELTSPKNAITKDGINLVLARVSKGSRIDQKIAEGYLAISKKFTTSPFGVFGLAQWSEVNPKTARDWAYLIAKQAKKPLHFTELVSQINNHRKTKITNVQTVHNELIKDNRFVLVGRGIYGLREHGYLAGTAREVLSHFIKKNGALSGKDLAKLVLSERIFKEGTLLINLQNKKHFKRLDDGRYALAEA